MYCRETRRLEQDIEIDLLLHFVALKSDTFLICKTFVRSLYWLVSQLIVSARCKRYSCLNDI